MQKLTKLQAAVLEQLDGDSFSADVVNHGADGGFSGFTYHADTCRFTLDNWSDIVELCLEMIDGCYDAGASLAQFIAGFNCMKGYTVAEVERVLMDRTNEELDGHTTVLNALAWFALEETARAIVQE